jgi:hypothetical protein
MSRLEVSQTKVMMTFQRMLAVSHLYHPRQG